ncbi:uncharacterized protein DDB_G0284459-like [Cylas formicarius]|uniref:uncharacterized protein DDB_G0284459-like n=1 Tax=Cylas formicarius TaxID=197179 RepID=UPI002958B91B|nr:uncharacterized protein DDB_G0284459-like [Cylas formicarius]
MTKTGIWEPKLLPNILDAIAKMKEKNGSSQDQILERVCDSVGQNKRKIRNLAVQVKRALVHGISSGLVKQKRGKYVLGLDDKDYTIFKKFSAVRTPLEAKMARRGRGKSRGRRRRRRRSRRGRRSTRRRAFGDVGDPDLEDNEEDGSEPEDRTRGRRRRRRRSKGRRRRRRGRGRRRGGRGRRASGGDTHLAEPAGKKVAENNNRSDNNNKEYQQNSNGDKSPERSGEDGGDCDIPDCVCRTHPERESAPPQHGGYYN